MVGSHLADYLLKKTKIDVFGVCRWRSPLDNVNHLLDKANKKERLYFLNGDLNDYISVDKVIREVKPDYVFHLAAQSYPKTSFDEPHITFNTNINGTYNLLDTLKNHSKKSIIHICSSSEVFGRVPKEKVPIDENCSFHPASPYAISKVGTDLIGRYFHEAFKMKILTTRMFTHTGPRRGDVFAESSFAKQIALIENNKIPPIIYTGNLNSMRTIADVRDAVRAYYLLVSKNLKYGNVYNIGGQYSCTVREILDYLISLSKFKGKIKVKTDPKRLRPIDADLQIPNTKKFYDDTGWKPKIKFEKTMNDLLNYWRQRVKNNNFLQR